MASAHIRRIPFDEYEGNHNSRDLTQRLRRAIERASTRIPVAANSRVARWEADLARFDSIRDRRAILEQMIPGLKAGTWDHPNRHCLRALVDSRLFTTIVEQLLPDLTDADLRDLVAGNYHPEDDKPGKRTRDREFELFIAAVARRARLPVQLSEPDIAVRHGPIWLSVAAKRVSSASRIDANLKKAAQQIEEAGLPGFIVVDVTRVIDPDCRMVAHWRAIDQVFGKRMLDFVEGPHEPALRRRRSEYVRGVLVHAAFPLCSQGFKWGTFETMWPLTVDGLEPIEVHAFTKVLLPGFDGS